MVYIRKLRLPRYQPHEAFLRGVASIFDLMPKTANKGRVKLGVPKQTIEEVLAEDWKKVGESIRKSTSLTDRYHLP